MTVRGLGLAEHVGDVYVLQTHPVDKRVCMTAGYDGRIRLWDIERGRCLQTFKKPAPEVSCNTPL